MASALGELFLMINDENIHQLIVNELLILSQDQNPAVEKSATYSLESIGREVYKLDMFNKLLNLFYHLKDNVETKITPFQAYYILFYHLISKFYNFFSSTFTKTKDKFFRISILLFRKFS